MKIHHRIPFKKAIRLAAISLVSVILVSSFVSAETYTSANYKYPYSFGNDIFDMEHNDMQFMDVVNYDNHEIILFTMCSTQDYYDSYLYYYIIDTDAHDMVPINNSCSLDFKIKACVFNDMLYLFYSPSSSSGNYSCSHVYYRTATWLYDTKEKTYKLNFSGENSMIPGGNVLSVQVAQVMNGEMYLIYTDKSSGNYNWYYTKTSDGLNFQPGVQFYSMPADTLKGISGAVFQVPDDENGCVEKMMLAYSIYKSGSAILNCLFFDGQSHYGEKTINYTAGLIPYSIKLIAGSSQDYTNTKYSIQAFIASPEGGDKQNEFNIYHAEYIPSGQGGDEGSWSVWTMLSTSKDDVIKNYINAYTPDPSWAVIPYFQATSGGSNPDLRMYVRVWYSRGTSYSWPSTDHVNFRCSSYVSDLLKYLGTTNVPAAQQDLSISTIIGIIEGTPPFPINSGVSGLENVSVVELGAEIVQETDTAITVDNTVVASYSKKFLAWGLNLKFSAGLLYTYDQGFNKTVTTSTSFHSFTDTTPGDNGWVLVFKPEIYNYQYVLKSYDGSSLVYDGNTGGDDEFTMSVIYFGPGSYIDNYPYKLQNPAQGYDYSDIFQGMALRSLSTDIDYWQGITPDYQTPSCCFSTLQLTTLDGSEGTTNKYEIVAGETTANTFAPHASFSVSAKNLGFEVADKVSFSVKMSSSTTLKEKLGFYYNIPPCGDSGGIAKINITPSLLLPKDDDSGYNCPWISDDIRNFQKPKPWCLSYLTYPLGYCDTGMHEVTADKGSATLYLDRTQSKHDRMHAAVVLKDIPKEFSLRDYIGLHLRFGNYIISSDSNRIYYEVITRNMLRLGFSEAGNPESKIRIVVNHDNRKSILRIKAHAENIDLSSLSTYGLENKTTSRRGEAIEIPFSFLIGEKYHSTAVWGGLYAAEKDEMGIATIWY